MSYKGNHPPFDLEEQWLYAKLSLFGDGLTKLGQNITALQLHKLPSECILKKKKWMYCVQRGHRGIKLKRVEATLSMNE